MWKVSEGEERREVRVGEERRKVRVGDHRRKGRKKKGSESRDREGNKK